MASAPLHRPLAVGVALVLGASMVGCESELNLVGTPARPLQGEGQAVRAILAPTAAGTSVTIDDPSGLPAFVREARELKVGVGGQTAVVSRPSAGHYSFVLPAATRLTPDVAGNVKVLFIADERESQLITLQTGTPLQFGNPPVTTDPSPAFVVRGMKVKLAANTPAGTDRYEFAWYVSSTGTAPWQAIPGLGKEASWTPTAAGSYHVRVDAVDRATRQSYTTVTPAAVVFVTESKGVVTTAPASGAITRGQGVRLTFRRPEGFAGEPSRVTWSYGASAQGPWTAIPGQGTSLDWLPPTLGAWHIKAEAVSATTGETSSFTSSEPLVFVSEGASVIAAGPAAVERGDRVSLTLNADGVATSPVSWFYSRTGASALGTTWTPLLGTGKSNDLVVNEAGTYSFRADVASAGGQVRTFTSTEPQVTVTEGSVPLITTDPPNTMVIKQGGAVTLRLNARGVDEDRFNYLWFITTSPAVGWTSLPLDVADAKLKTYQWDTEQRVSVGGFTTLVTQPAGSYYVRVDATEVSSPRRTYTFTSSGPVVTIENQ